MKKILLLICTVGLLTTSCNDFLSILPKMKRVPTTVADFEALLRHEYNVHREPIYMASILLNDYYVTGTETNASWIANYNWDETADRIALDNGNNTSPYFELYTAIAYCNLVLERIPGATEGTAEQKAEIMAYARVLRAMKYYTAVNYYAQPYVEATAATTRGVPFITSSSVGAPYPQTTVAQLYDFMISEVQGVIDDGSLPEESLTVLHPNLGTGYAFLARVYLTMGNYPLALANADLALAQNNALFDWRAFYEANSDVINDGSTTTTIPTPVNHTYVENYNYSQFGNQNIRAIAIPQARGAGFEEGDARFLATYFLYTLSETYYRGKLLGLWNYAGMQTTEAYLIKAECHARAGEFGLAMDALNAVRVTRIFPGDYTPRVATTLSQAIDYIRQTKSNELMFSICTFADARRWNLDPATQRTLTKVVDGQVRTLSPTSHLWTFPFPKNAIGFTSGGVIVNNVDR